MLTLTPHQLETWMAQLLWPFVRIGACLMVAPVFGALFVPPRVRLVLAGAIALLIAPLIVLPPDIQPLSATGVVITVDQLIIGAALGFCLQILFAAVNLGGQVLANTMGLSFAFNIDPEHGASTPVLGQFYTILVTLTFLALDGHLALIDALVGGFRTLPVGAAGPGTSAMWSLITWGSQLFSGAVSIALPGVTALLIVNLAFGVMSRAAPALNLFAVGLPGSLLFGLVIVLVGLPTVQSTFVRLLGECFQLLQQISVRS